jgi:hypothetical protein
MPEDEKQVTDTLTLPAVREEPINVRHAYWLKLADIALSRARMEQKRIKEKIKPHVEQFKRIQARRSRKTA